MMECMIYRDWGKGMTIDESDLNVYLEEVNILLNFLI